MNRRETGFFATQLGSARTARLAVLILVAAAPAGLYAQPDYTWTFVDDGGSSYILTAVSSSKLYAGSLPAEDPTLNLIQGRRYRAIIQDPGTHPFDIVALGSNSGEDTVLLAQGAGTGTMEGDGTVAWVDVGDGTVEFTLSPSLVAAFTAGGKTPGYRCNAHPDSMRGQFALYGTGTFITNPIAATIPTGTRAVELELVMSGLVSPVGLADPNDGSGRLFICDQAGFIRVHPAGTVALDVRSRMVTLSAGYDERGLLGVALHPNFAANRKLYTYTSEPRVPGAEDFTVPMTGNPNHQAVVAEWVVSATDPNTIDSSSRRELLRIDEPQGNHNGGQLRFGPDGKLYISLGDGGSSDDMADGHSADGNAQDLTNVLGTLLRIDVDGNNSANGRYGVPADNPFVGVAGVDEIWAYGFRNPYRFSFDRLTGDLYVGDVGQNKIEEVDRVEKGKNYGWRWKEGSFYFDPNGASAGQVTTVPVAPLPPDLVDPIAEYDHDDGISVIGGHVYRGAAITQLSGVYLFGDFARTTSTPSGRVFYLDAANDVFELQIGSPTRPLGLFLKGMDEDAAGEVYLCTSSVLGPSGTGGAVYKLIPLPTTEVPRAQWAGYR
ncbi:PQQ-dependent sugar dehydrogenase [bacterium]|nr:PQQ-dependent sugar dehydrogenase [bacterium]